jgi:GNAT superfamily N-acetyltransferase
MRRLRWESSERGMTEARGRTGNTSVGDPDDAVIAVVSSAEEVARCWPILQKLRPHLASPEAAVGAWCAQRSEGYKLAYIEQDGRPVAAIGYRVLHTLAWGRVLYVDDLIVDPEYRRRGLAENLMQHATAVAESAGCRELHLDSGYGRHDAHRFYLRHGFDLQCHHFARPVRRP